MRNIAHKRHAPECAKIDARTAGLEDVERGGSLLQKFWLGCFSTATVKQLRKSEDAAFRDRRDAPTPGVRAGRFSAPIATLGATPAENRSGEEAGVLI